MVSLVSVHRNGIPMEKGVGTLEDGMALQLALELSRLNVNNHEPGFTDGGAYDEGRGSSRYKSNNTTECVPVPSSEHVAEIVGRQGSWLCSFPFVFVLCGS
jgi:RNA-binding protein MEX3